MLKYLPYALQALAAIGGIFIGAWLKAPSAPAGESAPAAHKEDAHGASKSEAKTEKGKEKSKKAEKKKSSAKKSSHGDKKAGESSDHGYMKFSRQFIVPVLDQSGMSSLVVMDINIEVPNSSAQSIYALEPKLRDAMLSALLRLSNGGAFAGKLLEQANLDNIRADLLAAARGVIGEEAQNVLILNITRQDV